MRRNPKVATYRATFNPAVGDAEINKDKKKKKGGCLGKKTNATAEEVETQMDSERAKSKSAKGIKETNQVVPADESRLNQDVSADEVEVNVSKV